MERAQKKPIKTKELHNSAPIAPLVFGWGLGEGYDECGM